MPITSVYVGKSSNFITLYKTCKSLVFVGISPSSQSDVTDLIRDSIEKAVPACLLVCHTFITSNNI